MRYHAFAGKLDLKCEDLFLLSCAAVKESKPMLQCSAMMLHCAAFYATLLKFAAIDSDSLSNEVRFNEESTLLVTDACLATLLPYM